MISIGDDLHARISIDLMRLTFLVMMRNPYVSAALQRSFRGRLHVLVTSRYKMIQEKNRPSDYIMSRTGTLILEMSREGASHVSEPAVAGRLGNKHGSGLRSAFQSPSTSCGCLTILIELSESSLCWRARKQEDLSNQTDSELAICRI